MSILTHPQARKSHTLSVTAAWQHALDNRIPQTTATNATEAHWRKHRDVQRPQDLVLSNMAKRWVELFPRTQQPTNLVRHFPRIANRLALCWSDPKLTGMVLFDLLIDKRGGRRGFPPEVLSELRQLRATLGELELGGAPRRVWEVQVQATSDR